MKISFEETRCGLMGASVTYYDETLNKEATINMCSKYDPLKEAKSWVQRIYDETKDAFLIYGMGMGYHISELLSRLKDNQKLYVIEANVDFWNQAERYIDAEIKEDRPNYKFIITQDMQQLPRFLQEIKGKKVVFALYGPSIKIVPKGLEEFKNLLELYCLRSQDQGDCTEVAVNCKHNNNMGYPNISKFFNKIHKPIIIVSGGPSLNKNIDCLKHINENVFIFSTARTLSTLINHGIRVDMFSMIDVKPWMYRQIEGYENLNIPFVFLNTASPKAVESYNGPKYMAYNTDSPKDQEGRIESGGSVATAMLDMAIHFGGNPIIFIGQDLAYTDNASHCENAMGAAQIDTSGFKQVKDAEGNYVPTTDSLLSYKYWIEKKIRMNKQIRFINATEGGAFIEGCEYKKLADVLKELNAVDDK